MYVFTPEQRCLLSLSANIGQNPTKVRKVTLPFPYPAGVPSFSSGWRLPILGDDPGG